MKDHEIWNAIDVALESLGYKLYPYSPGTAAIKHLVGPDINLAYLYFHSSTMRLTISQPGQSFTTIDLIEPDADVIQVIMEKL